VRSPGYLALYSARYACGDSNFPEKIVVVRFGRIIIAWSWRLFWFNDYGLRFAGGFQETVASVIEMGGGFHPTLFRHFALGSSL
jgi:hypothetical protein